MSEKESVMKSELAVIALSAIEKKDSSYTSEIARLTDKSQTSIDRIVRKMAQADFLTSEKKGRAKYYSIDYESIINYWLSNLTEEANSSSPRLELLDEIVEEREGYDIDSEKINNRIKNNLEKYREDIEQFAEKYLISILQADPGTSSLQEILNIGLYIDLIKYKSDSREHFPHYLDVLNKVLKRKVDVFTLSYQMEELVEELGEEIEESG